MSQKPNNLSSFKQLEHLPRVQLAHLPTPIDALPNLSRNLGGPELFIKRDDQTGLATGGNKARKLEFSLAEALEAGADTVITGGSTQSNHARQTAAAAARCGLKAHTVLYTPDGQPPQAFTGNVLLMHLLGAVIHWTTEHAPYAETIAQVEADLLAQGKRPYVVPYGGSNPTGMMGYVAAMAEFAAQIETTGPFDAVVFATSSGGTQAGMLLGAHLAGLPSNTQLLGISVDKPADALAAWIATLANAGAEKLHVDWRIDASDVAVNDHYLGGGYAVVGEPEREAVYMLAQQEGILLDPVYTGRTFAGLIDLIRRGTFTSAQRVLYWHTGGSAALFAYADALV
ncbi:MAG: D-cysteine desulfhydrase family protein [Anaerolineae bacterium]|nr:D-cysteine desulfhydrase family protein [Anaerolineae bacterium]